eukprot:gene10904-3608_t
MSTLDSLSFFQDFEQDYMPMLNCQPEDPFMDCFDLDFFQQVHEEKGQLIDQIDEHEQLIMEQQKELEALKERNRILKYNLQQKRQITQYIQSVHGMIFETSNLPIVIHSGNNTILSWNRAAAAFHEYEYEDLHKTVNYSIQLLEPYDGDVETLIKKFAEAKKISQSFIIDFERKARDGSKIVGKVLLEFFPNGTNCGIVLEHKKL